MTLFRKPRMWLIGITLIAGLLRFTYLLQIEHNTDRAYPIWQALMTLERGVFPLVGQGTSVLFANPPGMGYLLLPVMALTHHALGAYIFVIALNTLGVWFTYKAVRLIASPRASLIAAFLMAVNPWVIEYSRLTWVQGLLPFLVPALAWALWSALLGRAKHPARRLILAFVLLTIAAQTYLLAFALVIPVGLTVMLWLWKPWTNGTDNAGVVPTQARRPIIRGLIIGVVIFAAFAALYGAGLLGQSETVGAQLASFGQNPSHLSGEALSHAIRLVTGQDYAIARGVDALDGDSALRQNLSQIVHYVLLAAMIGGAALCVYRAVCGDRRGLLPLIWFGVPVALMSYVGQVVHPFYQLIGIPAGFAFAGVGIDVLMRIAGRRIGNDQFGMGIPQAPPSTVYGRGVGGEGLTVPAPSISRPYGARVLIILAIPFGVLMAINSIRYAQETWRYPGAHGLTALSLEYGLPLGAGIRTESMSKKTVFADADGWIINSLVGATFDTSRDVRAPDVQIIPLWGGYYISTTDISQSLQNNPLDPLWEEQLNQKWILRDETQLISRSLFFIAYSNTMSPNLNVVGNNGIRPRAYLLKQQADLVELAIFWQLDLTLPEYSGQTAYAPFAHIFDADGNRVLIVDGQVVPGSEWRPGDVHYHVMRFTLPEDGNPPYTVAIGQYDGQRGENAIFITPDGEYTALVTLPEQITPEQP